MPPGSVTFIVHISNGATVLTPTPTDGDSTGNFTLIFNDVPSTTTGGGLDYVGASIDQIQGTALATLNCLHGSSLI